jgi:hypothetical protein
MHHRPIASGSQYLPSFFIAECPVAPDVHVGSQCPLEYLTAIRNISFYLVRTSMPMHQVLASVVTRSDGRKPYLVIIFVSSAIKFQTKGMYIHAGCCFVFVHLFCCCREPEDAALKMFCVWRTSWAQSDAFDLQGQLWEVDHPSGEKSCSTLKSPNTTAFLWQQKIYGWIYVS